MRAIMALLLLVSVAGTAAMRGLDNRPRLLVPLPASGPANRRIGPRHLMYDIIGGHNASRDGIAQICSSFGVDFENSKRQLLSRKVFDCFLASHELDMMEIRTRELESVVDAFIIVESRMTFRGRPKPLHVPRLMSRLPGTVLSKIRYYVLDALQGEDAWSREKFQRDALLGAALLQLHPHPGDVLIVSDCDEIPKPEFVKAMKHCNGISYPLSMQATHHYYSFNLKSNKTDKVWNKPNAILYSRPWNTSAHELRSSPGKHVYPNSSWHCSTCFNSLAQVQTKIASFSHSELDLPDNHNPKNIIAG